jgi:hypothetical protein
MQGVGVDQAQPAQPGVLPQGEEVRAVPSQPGILGAGAVGLRLAGQALVGNDAAHRLDDERLVAPGRDSLLRSHRQTSLDHPVVIVGSGQRDPDPLGHLAELAGGAGHVPHCLQLPVLAVSLGQRFGGRRLGVD